MMNVHKAPQEICNGNVPWLLATEPNGQYLIWNSNSPLRQQSFIAFLILIASWLATSHRPHILGAILTPHQKTLR